MKIRTKRRDKPRTGMAAVPTGLLFSLLSFLAGGACVFIAMSSNDSMQRVSRRMDALVYLEENQGPDFNELGKPAPLERKPVLEPGFCHTSSTGYEIVLDSFLGAIFRENDVLPNGSVLDVGAQFGEMACHFASLAPNRQVHALDPSPSQCQQISKFAAMLPNLHVMNAGIGRTVGTGVAGPGFTGMNAGDNFRIETIDNLFFDKGEALAFAHIDVEGKELDVLKGGNETLQAYRPIFTVELRVHADPVYSKALFDFINALNYDTYVVDEPCGWPHMDYRNLICFPRSISDKLVFSDAFNLALATEAIFRVNRKTLFEKVYPCCALGGKCCQTNSTADALCCNEKIVRRWHRQAAVRKPIIMQGFTYSRTRLYDWWKEIRGRVGLSPIEAGTTAELQLEPPVKQSESQQI